MGQWYSSYFVHPDTAPNVEKPPLFDPLYGFENGRKKREMIATEEQMEAVGMKHEFRDYCAHILLDFYECRRSNYPWIAGCSAERHNWNHCEYEDMILRMKEYEREKRLLERSKKKGELEKVKQSEILAN